MKQLITLLFCLWSLTSLAQLRAPYNQYYLQPVLINPAYTGSSGITNIMVNHRVQWSGIKDAPVTTSAILHLPINERISLGTELYSDYHSSVLSTYEAKINGAYTLYFDTNGKNFLTFGLSLGVGRNVIDFEGTDQAILNALDRSFYFNGRFGTAVTIGRASFGFALPQLMDTDILNEKDFEDLGLEATKQSIIHASYKIPLGPLFQVETMGLYRLDKYGQNQLEGLGIVYYKDIIWGGAGYRQDYGAIGHFGLNIFNSLQIGYSYEFAPEQVTGIGNGSHEFQLTYSFGKKNKRRTPKRIITASAPPEKIEPAIEQTQPTEEIASNNTETVPSNKTETVASNTTETVSQRNGVKTTSAQIETSASSVARSQPTAPKSDIDKTDNSTDEEKVEWKEVDESREVSSLPEGCYLVVGAFVQADNAMRYQSAVNNLGYKAELAYDDATKFNYVYINKSVEAKYLHAQRDAIRTKDILYFKEAWILEIK